MRIRALLTGGVSAALAVAAFAMPGSAATGASGAPAGSAPASPAITAADLAGPNGQVTINRMAGVIPSRNARPATAAAADRAAAGCAEPDCNMTYHGGPVEHSPHVYIVFWGPNWNNKNTNEPAAQQYLISFYQGLGQAPDDWTRTESQYGDKGGHPVFGKSLYAGSFVDNGTPENPVSTRNLGSELNKAATHFNLSVAAARQSMIVIAPQSGTCYAPAPNGAVFAGNCGAQQTQGYCAYHSFAGSSSVYLPVVILPYQLDAGQGCGQDFVNPSGTFDGFSITAGHETAETITDPTIAAWYDANDLGISGGEIADKCAWGGSLWGQTPPDPSGNVNLPTGSFAMQSLWSNVRHGCVMRGKIPQFTVTALGNQSSSTATAVSLRVRTVTRPAGVPLTFTESGLPFGLSINRTTGLIHGKPNFTAGTFNVKITVSYYDGSDSFSFTWRVFSPAGPMTGLAAKCVDDASGHTANGNKIDISTCNGRAQQKLQFFSNSELEVLGKCVTGGSTVVLEPCSGSASQLWVRHGNGEYVLKATGTCLTDPHMSTKDGTQLTLAGCADNVNQRWSLP